LAYGPGFKLTDQRALNNFIFKAAKGDIHLLDNGSALRNYCYVSDTIEMLWNILLFGKEEVYNVGGVYTNSIFEIAEKIARIFEVKVVIPNDTETLLGAPKTVKLDMSRIRNEFHKTEFVHIDEGLKRTVEWYNSIYGEGLK
jgi:dTDP-glucose 4,6-dehydratase/UDP-glucuronate decarboxylase